MELGKELLVSCENRIYLYLITIFQQKKHRISEWLGKLGQRFVLADVEEDARKIKFCLVFIGQTGEDILAQLPDDTSWEEAKRELIDRLGDGMVEEEAWTVLKQLECGDKDIVDLGAEAAKLAKKAYPEQEEMANRQAVEAFVCVLDPRLALEVQKLGHCVLDGVIAAARCIECLQKDYPSPNMDNLVTVLQDELHAVRKELKESAQSLQTKLCMLHNQLQCCSRQLTQQQTGISLLPQVHTLLLQPGGTFCRIQPHQGRNI